MAPRGVQLVELSVARWAGSASSFWPGTAGQIRKKEHLCRLGSGQEDGGRLAAGVAGRRERWRPGGLL